MISPTFSLPEVWSAPAFCTDFQFCIHTFHWHYTFNITGMSNVCCSYLPLRDLPWFSSTGFQEQNFYNYLLVEKLNRALPISFTFKRLVSHAVLQLWFCASKFCSQHSWGDDAIFHLSEIIKKDLTRKVHRFVQEAPIKTPPCIADTAQST